MGNKPSTNKQQKSKVDTPFNSHAQQTSQPKIKPSTNKTANCGECDDIYHGCLELLTENDKWIVVWPLLLINDENNSTNNEKIFYLFDNKNDRDNQYLKNAIKF